ncbi:hypothetical protein HanXRQr2_Chr05g0235911 [Helianthus annuus]|uniref:Uncharacterized protein n=1 Tax=Helianthus annuus TaxID=4232 RepID=A0A9K3J3E2_HELAN|nr:hypothetical protein HanXRQr2_Chr05g0235911 [Helianthus annuus]
MKVRYLKQSKHPLISGGKEEVVSCKCNVGVGAFSLEVVVVTCKHNVA